MCSILHARRIMLSNLWHRRSGVSDPLARPRQRTSGSISCPDARSSAKKCCAMREVRQLDDAAEVRLESSSPAPRPAMAPVDEDLEVSEFGLDMVALDDDVLSLCLDSAFADVEVQRDSTTLFLLAQALTKLQARAPPPLPTLAPLSLSTPYLEHRRRRSVTSRASTPRATSRARSST